MSRYSTSQKIAMINEIDGESRELWVMLNDNADAYDMEDAKHLFVNIISKNQANLTRFDLNIAQAHIEAAIRSDYGDMAAEGRTPSKFDILSTCHRATRKSDMHSFLFDSTQY